MNPLSARDRETLMKVLRLGLHATATDGEWQTAMIKAGQIMRRLNLDPEDILGGNAQVVYRDRVVYRDGPRPSTSYSNNTYDSSHHASAHQRDGSWVFWFGKHKDSTVKAVARRDPSYLRWVVRTLTELPPEMMKEIRAAAGFHC